MTIYRLKSFIPYVIAVLVAIAVVAVPYSLLLYFSSINTLVGIGSLTPAVTFSIIAALASLFAIMDALVSWLKSWRENRVRNELVRVIDAQSKSPEGMDIDALGKETRLPRQVLQDRVNELILLGRIGVRQTPNNNREYFLVGSA